MDRCPPASPPADASFVILPNRCAGSLWSPVLIACSSSTESTPTNDASPLDSATDGGVDVATDRGAETGEIADVRGKRYCEILLVTVGATDVHVAVYNTFGLNDCPDEAWAKVDAKAVATEAGVSSAVLNGPRYWLLDAFETSSLKDPTPRTLGGIPMRLAANIDVPLSAAATLGKTPYTENTIQRDTTVRFDAGKPVHELVGADGSVYEMQSYSVQKVPQTLAELSTLGAGVRLGIGCFYQVGTPLSSILVGDVGGEATVVDEDDDSTYEAM